MMEKILLRLTFSCRQLVVKPRPRNTESIRGSLRTDRLLSHMPRLVELNIHVGVPLIGILSQGKLPTVKTLSVPINQVGPAYEATHIIRACPNVTLLRLNITGQSIRTGDGDGVSRPECRRALEEAATLGSLRALEMFKFGRAQDIQEWDVSSGFFSVVHVESLSMKSGWIPDDLKGTWKSLHKFAPTNDDTNSKFSHQGVLSPYLQSDSLRKRGIRWNER